MFKTMKKSVFVLFNKNMCINYVPCKFVTSFLYVTGDKARDIYSAVQPHIDFDERVKNITDLDNNVKKHRIDVDVFELQKLWGFYKTRLDYKQKLELNKNEIKSSLNKLIKNQTDEKKNEFEALKLKCQLVKDDLKNIVETVWDIENNVVIKTLKLPNDLHMRAPDEELVVRSFKSPSDFGRNHLEIGHSLNCLDYFNESCYYLKNDLALFEIVAVQYFLDQLTINEFIPFCNPDFSRSVLVEGCTLKTEAPDIAMMLKDTEKNQKHKVYLNGGASFLPFFGFHTKTFVNVSALPLRYVTQGRQYNPNPIKHFNGLYSVLQSTAVEFFIATSHESDLTFEFDDTVAKLTDIYKSLDIHFRVVYTPTYQLKSWESLRASFQLYSPINKSYIEVGNVSLLGDFISKRLRACYSNKQNKLDFLNVVSGTAVKFPILMANLLETSKENIYIPEVLKDKLIFY